MSEHQNDLPLPAELHAFEATSDAHEDALRALGEEVIHAAENTIDTYVDEDLGCLLSILEDDAQDYEEERRGVGDEAEAIAAYPHQVANAGEDIRPGDDSDFEDWGVAAGAEQFLQENQHRQVDWSSHPLTEEAKFKKAALEDIKWQIGDEWAKRNRPDKGRDEDDSAN